MQATRNPFADQPETYASARPHYPPALFDWLASSCRRRASAWDCATGNGQAAFDLAARFEQVFASDISAEQIEHARRAPNLHYSIQPAEQTDFPDHRFDLVVVAQALHWFNPAAFWPEVRRVARPGALFCAWGYDRLHTDAEVEHGLVAPLLRTLAPFWAPGNRILWDGYQDRDTAFPFERIATPAFSIEMHWTLQALIDYMQTWSAYQRSRADTVATAAMDQLFADARQLTPEGATLRVSMPLKMVAGYVPGRA
ncbi:class I SAM-dependent methyltransferase [Aquabacterium sp. A7-Y]|uniref:class I SAM-dependent methyltransferase n=1 Tax=Aquabacterium sp. A7-Y TaxID=1349605 RepID=UPI00223D60C8|nr:class I SAM-dependent methyltransferase [Aquabacterium sp. A7-Y]MCW7537660.1 class I SAM-dependent methyltransferase [Aquabacterium sp. A7-Y]